MRYTLYLTITVIVAVTSSLLLLPLLSIYTYLSTAQLEPSHGVFLVLLVVGGLLTAAPTGGGLSQQVAEPAEPPVRFSRPVRPALQSRFVNPRQARQLR